MHLPILKILYSRRSEIPKVSKLVELYDRSTLTFKVDVERVEKQRIENYGE